ncbi:MAG: hypothetical protein DMF69_11120 [Acidobacteria bacterium]|nr:MAG: hypothetical protein DMF69_11120 [Acidobacteriota bacterium]
MKVLLRENATDETRLLKLTKNYLESGSYFTQTKAILSTAKEQKIHWGFVQKSKCHLPQWVERTSAEFQRMS